MSYDTRWESPNTIRQYDIWIDGQKLDAVFLPDQFTQVGYRLLLRFDGDVQRLNTESSDEFCLRRMELQANSAQLQKARIWFQLQDTAKGLQVCIWSYLKWAGCQHDDTPTDYRLMWAECQSDGTHGTLVPFPTNDTKAQLVFGRTYVLQAQPTDGSLSTSTMTLRVTDPLECLEVGDDRSPSPVLDAPDWDERRTRLARVQQLLDQLLQYSAIETMSPT